MAKASFNTETIVKIPMDDQGVHGGWSIQVSREDDTEIVYFCLHYNGKLTPTHVASMTLAEFDSLYNKIRG